jgi:hypothetical protein
MDVLQSTEHFFMNVLPVATPIIVAWFSYKLPKKSKEQTDQIISELSEVKKQIEDVQATTSESNKKISQIQDKQKLHDDAHQVIMRMRLDRDIRRAIRRGFTNKDECSIVDSMYASYKALGGNGFIDRLYDNFGKLPFKDDGLFANEKEGNNGL